jgi:uncharacterized protein YpuA (DUF1002 family)
MKNWKFLALLFTICGSVAFAQHGMKHGRHKGGKMQNPEARAAQLTENLTEKLSLTADQKQKVQALTLSRITQMQEIKKEYGNNEENFKPKAKAIQEEYRKQMKATLTEEQLTKLKAWRKEMQEQRKQQRDEHRSRHQQYKDVDFLEGIE